MSTKESVVAIVGRANVGKSTLFNAILGRREAITADEPGTTRDPVTAKASWRGSDFWLVDTAGYKSAQDEFELSIQEQISDASAAADVILVVVSADVDPTDEDRRVAKMALKTKKPVILLVNKVDRVKGRPLDSWQKLGIKPHFGVSAVHKSGLSDALDYLSANLPKTRIKEPPSKISVGILGRPNVGKSSLFNSLAAKQQAITSSKAGTTRDINRLSIRFKNQDLEFMDTAGIRRSGKIGRGVEYFSVLRSLSTIQQADVCLLVMDAQELNVQLDQKIAGMISEAGKGMILVVNKFDAVEDSVSRERVSGEIAHNFAFAPWAPLIFTSAQTGQNVTKLFDLVIEIAQERKTKLKTTELNRWLSSAVSAHPPAGLKNYTPKLNYIVQEDDNPMPSFKIFGSHTKYLHWSYKRYLERKFREVWPLAGTPLKFWFIEKH